ncbi:glycerophosphodiester phosphodiesterase family protein [uncultured Tenacibaculum sp.]|uniref:glycerophosphodiester phosphodiesterase family protein n=1 Tax=uncultured Tenacibaculum sp. TaxID=174713 RepID=UPI00262028FD|nr:glycerophosphodiester phosphodiesterase family protein [uncultured Tenacibaculum sp.]
MKFLKLIIPVFLISLFVVNCKNKETKKAEIEKVEKVNSSKKNLDIITSFEAWKKNPVPLISAHRGGPYPGFPENAIETFNNVAEQASVVIECDVAMSKDSVLVLMHDNKLNRTTNGEGPIQDKTYKELQGLKLVDNEGNITEFKIPTLDEVLTWGKNKVLFTLDIKRGVPFEKVIAAVEKHKAIDYAAIITYSVNDATLVHSLNKEVMISVSAGNDGALEQIEKANLPADKLLGFVGTRQPELTHYEKLKEKGIKTILGTLGNLDKSAVAKGDDSIYLTYIKNGANIIATDRPLEVAKVLNKQ